MLSRSVATTYCEDGTHQPVKHSTVKLEKPYRFKSKGHKNNESLNLECDSKVYSDHGFFFQCMAYRRDSIDTGYTGCLTFQIVNVACSFSSAVFGTSSALLKFTLL